jgi:hypothetical protein
MTILDDFSRDPEHVLDRLVDGELPPHECRQLLAALDDEPGGWRRCALAFLEAQCWRHQLSRAAAEPILAQLSAQSAEIRSGKRRFWGALAAAAACVLVAFAAGTRFPTVETAREAPHTAHHPAPAAAPAAALAKQLPGKADSPSDAPGPSPWQTLTLTPADGSSAEPFRLRVVEPGSDAASTLAHQEWAVSGQLLRRFEQEGFEVNRQERLLPIELSDGRRVLVPIEEVDIRSPDVARL